MNILCRVALVIVWSVEFLINVPASLMGFALWLAGFLVLTFCPAQWLMPRWSKPRTNLIVSVYLIDPTLSVVSPLPSVKSIVRSM